jgi:hypothetical protein
MITSAPSTKQLFDLHFAIHLKAPAILAEAMADGLPQDCEGSDCQHHRSAGMAADTAFLLLHIIEIGACGRRRKPWRRPLLRGSASTPSDPGPTLANERQSPDDFARQAAAVPLGHGPDLAEFGATIRYLRQARSVTGQMIALDGGQHLSWKTPDVTDVGE